MITPDIYERSLQVYHILQSGVVQYRAISTASNLLISDCIHAVAAVDPVFGRGHYPLIRIGDPASRFLAREIVVRGVENRGIDQAAYDNSWLIPRLGLDRYAIGVVSPAADPAPPLPPVPVPGVAEVIQAPTRPGRSSREGFRRHAARSVPAETRGPVEPGCGHG